VNGMTDTETLRIRRAALEDARAMAEVHVGSWRHAYRGLLPDAYLERLSVEDREAMWRSAVDQAEAGAFVAEEGGRIVGFSSFGPSRDDDAGERTGEIPAIYVEPSTIGRGIGRELLQAATAALRDEGFERATLWVLEANERARRFYEKAGWSWDGTVDRHDFDCANEPVVRYAIDL
jgi:ribosomal protein S18 acetylase RimI-like enzyme